MNRRAFLKALSGSLLAAPFVAEAQQAPRTYRIGFLDTGLRQDETSTLAGFRQGFLDIGYLEGKNFRIGIEGPMASTSAWQLLPMGWCAPELT